VRGHYETLNQAVLAGNWPALAHARGKVIFLMDQRPVGPIYLAGHPSLRGRVLFTNAEPGEPDAAFIERNDGPAADITALVKKGYLIRTRTDADTKEARTNDTARRDQCLPPVRRFSPPTIQSMSPRGGQETSWSRFRVKWLRAPIPSTLLPHSRASRCVSLLFVDEYGGRPGAKAAVWLGLPEKP